MVVTFSIVFNVLILMANLTTAIVGAWGHYTLVAVSGGISVLVTTLVLAAIGIFSYRKAEER